MSALRPWRWASPLIALALALAPPALAQVGVGASLERLDAQRYRAQSLLSRADALGEALGLAQLAFDRRRASSPGASCRQDPGTAALVPRTRVLGQAQRNALQSARVAVAKLLGTAEDPTVAPLLLPEERAELAALTARLDAALRAWEVAAQWQAQRVEPWAAPCGLSLSAGPGERPPVGVPWAAEVAVLGVGPGLICPGGGPAEGAVVLLPRGRPLACYAETQCDCIPEAQLPGAVLGPVPGAAAEPGGEVPP